MHPPREHRTPERTGILVIRVWLEGDAAGQLKARLTQVGDLGEAATTMATAADVRGVCEAVERWLQQLLHPPRVW